MKDLKIRVATEKESKEAQELFLELGVKWRRSESRSPIVSSLDYPFFAVSGHEGLYLTDSKMLSDIKEITLQELRDMVNQDRDEPFLTPETTLNDQYAEIEQVRKQTIEATLAERQAQYGCFEDVAFVTENIMAVLSEVRTNGLNDLPHTHRMALYMIASKMARIVNGDFNHKDLWHDIGGYSKLIEDLL